MSIIRRFALTEALLLLMILLAGTTATVTEARYHIQRRAGDLARVARPVMRVISLTEASDLGTLLPGTVADFEFTVDNESASEGVSEVGLDYRLAVAIDQETPLSLSLFWMDAAGSAHACPAGENGTYTAVAPLGTEAESHRYRLILAWPADAQQPAADQILDVRIEVTAWQRDA